MRLVALGEQSTTQVPATLCSLPLFPGLVNLCIRSSKIKVHQRAGPALSTKNGPPWALHEEDLSPSPRKPFALGICTSFLTSIWLFSMAFLHVDIGKGKVSLISAADHFPLLVPERGSQSQLSPSPNGTPESSLNRKNDGSLAPTLRSRQCPRQCQNQCQFHLLRSDLSLYGSRAAEPWKQSGPRLGFARDVPRRVASSALMLRHAPRASNRAEESTRLATEESFWLATVSAMWGSRVTDDDDEAQVRSVQPRTVRLNRLGAQGRRVPKSKPKPINCYQLRTKLAVRNMISCPYAVHTRDVVGDLQVCKRSRYILLVKERNKT